MDLRQRRVERLVGYQQDALTGFVDSAAEFSIAGERMGKFLQSTVTLSKKGLLFANLDSNQVEQFMNAGSYLGTLLLTLSKKMKPGHMLDLAEAISRIMLDVMLCDVPAVVTKFRYGCGQDLANFLHAAQQVLSKADQTISEPIATQITNALAHFRDESSSFRAPAGVPTPATVNSEHAVVQPACDAVAPATAALESSSDTQATTEDATGNDDESSRAGDSPIPMELDDDQGTRSDGSQSADERPDDDTVMAGNRREDDSKASSIAAVLQSVNPDGELAGGVSHPPSDAESQHSSNHSPSSDGSEAPAAMIQVPEEVMNRVTSPNAAQTRSEGANLAAMDSEVDYEESVTAPENTTHEGTGLYDSTMYTASGQHQESPSPAPSVEVEEFDRAASPNESVRSETITSEYVGRPPSALSSANSPLASERASSVGHSPSPLGNVSVHGHNDDSSPSKVSSASDERRSMANSVRTSKLGRQFQDPVDAFFNAHTQQRTAPPQGAKRKRSPDPSPDHDSRSSTSSALQVSLRKFGWRQIMRNWSDGNVLLFQEFVEGGLIIVQQVDDMVDARGWQVTNVTSALLVSAVAFIAPTWLAALSEGSWDDYSVLIKRIQKWISKLTTNKVVTKQYSMLLEAVSRLHLNKMRRSGYTRYNQTIVKLRHTGETLISQPVSFAANTAWYQASYVPQLNLGNIVRMGHAVRIHLAAQGAVDQAMVGAMLAKLRDTWTFPAEDLTDHNYYLLRPGYYGINPRVVTPTMIMESTEVHYPEHSTQNLALRDVLGLPTKATPSRAAATPAIGNRSQMLHAVLSCAAGEGDSLPDVLNSDATPEGDCCVSGASEQQPPMDDMTRPSFASTSGSLTANLKWKQPAIVQFGLRIRPSSALRQEIRGLHREAAVLAAKQAGLDETLAQKFKRLFTVPAGDT